MHCKIPYQGHNRESDFVSISVAYLYDPHYSDPWTEASGTGQRLAMIAGTLKYSTDSWLEAGSVEQVLDEVLTVVSQSIVFRSNSISSSLATPSIKVTFTGQSLIGETCTSNINQESSTPFPTQLPCPKAGTNIRYILVRFIAINFEKRPPGLIVL